MLENISRRDYEEVAAANVLFRERNSLPLFSSLDQYQGEKKSFSSLIVQYHLNDGRRRVD